MDDPSLVIAGRSRQALLEADACRGQPAGAGGCPRQPSHVVKSEPADVESLDEARSCQTVARCPGALECGSLYEQPFLGAGQTLASSTELSSEADRMTPRRIRLRRTALFLFGSLALVLSACGDDDDTGLFQGTGGGGNDNGSGGSLLGKGGSGNAGTSAKGGSDAGGSSSKGGSAGKGGTSSKGGTGGTAGVGGKGGSSSGSGGAGGDEPAGGNGGDAGNGGSENPAGAGGSGGSSGQGGVGASGGTGGNAGAGGKAGAGGAGASGGSTSGNGGASSGSGGTAAGNGGSASGAAGNGGGAGGASAGSGGVGGSPYTGAIVPTTCAEAHGFPGCCGPDGKTIYYFDKGKVEQTTCENAGNVCGWNDSVKYYDCQPSTKVDPTNKYPLRCGGEPVEGVCSSGGAGGGAGAGGGTAGGGGANGDGIPETCSEAHGTFGCCVGDTLYTGNVLTATPQSCAATNQKCGWNNSTKRYACGTGTASDPTGTNARACFGPFTGGGCLN